MKSTTLGRLALVAIVALAAQPSFAQQVRVFVTSTTYTGDLVTQASELCPDELCADGLEAGDAICNARAAVGALGGQWRAWLSTGTTDAKDRLAEGSGPFVLATGPQAQIAADKPALLSTGDVPLQSRINYDELGQPNPGVNFVWTGTQPSGFADEDRCGDWIHPALVGRTGDTTITNAGWTALFFTDCGFPQHLYCFEVPPAPTPTPATSRQSLALAAGLMMLLLAGSYLVRRRAESSKAGS